MELLMKNIKQIKNVLLVLLVFMILLLTGCSTIASLIPGGSNSQVLVSELPRADVNDATVEDLEQLAAGNRTFAMDLYHQLETMDGNLFYSPYSISSALAMTYAGAEGKTAEETVELAVTEGGVEYSVSETLHQLEQEMLDISGNSVC